MLNKFGFQFIGLIFLFAIILLLPIDVVWGGQNFQTIPTIGPSRTPTATNIGSTTQPINTQQPGQDATSTKTISITLVYTIEPTIKVTRPSATKTEIPMNTEKITPSEALEVLDSSNSVVLPLVSSGDGNQPGQLDNQNGPEENSPIPAFIFPALIILVLIVLYFIIRLTIKKPLNNQIPK
jgi:hypothetical protein